MPARQIESSTGSKSCSSSFWKAILPIRQRIATSRVCLRKAETRTPIRAASSESSTRNARPQPGGNVGFAVPQPLKMDGPLCHCTRASHVIGIGSPASTKDRRTVRPTGGNGGGKTAYTPTTLRFQIVPCRRVVVEGQHVAWLATRDAVMAGDGLIDPLGFMWRQESSYKETPTRAFDMHNCVGRPVRVMLLTSFARRNRQS